MSCVINNIISSGSAGRAEFQLDSLTYSWSSAAGELVKQDILLFPLLTSIFKLSSNAPVRLRLYRSLAARAIDLMRPPHIIAERNSGILLEGIFGGSSAATQLALAPFCLLSGMSEIPIILEKLSPDAGIINLTINLIK